jgi:hypothetical protein
MKTLIAFVLTFSMALAAVTCPAGEPVKRADAAYGVSYVQEQVIQLPQDQGKFYLTVFGNEGEYRFEQVKSWVANDPQLHALKAQTTYNIYRADSVMFRERYAQGVSNIPCVRLQEPDGTVIYEALGTSVPMSAEALYNGIAEGCRKRHCRPCPQPAPVTPSPVTPSPTPVTPAPIVKPVPVVHDFPHPGVEAALVAVGLLLGLGVAFVSCFKKEMSAKK